MHHKDSKRGDGGRELQEGLIAYCCEYQEAEESPVRAALWGVYNMDNALSPPEMSWELSNNDTNDSKLHQFGPDELTWLMNSFFI